MLTETVVELWRREADKLLRFSELACPLDAPKPRWATPGEARELGDSIHLRVYGEGDGVPILIITPQVNHSYIADFAPDQSLVRTMLSAGATRVAVTDWQPPPTRPYHIADSIDDILACVDDLGGRAHLVGLCQGGWQAAIAAALHPERVSTLTLAAAPVDTRKGITGLHLFIHGLPMSWFQALVKNSGGKAPGAALAAGFDLLRPYERFFGAYFALYQSIDDAEYCERYEAMRNWYRLNKDLAGPLYLEAVEYLFKKNLLAKNRLMIRERRVELDRIDCPIYLVAGSKDHITPPAQVFALATLATNAPSARKLLIDAGHIGTFMGRTALKNTWPPLTRNLLSH